jgi:hypothetical protein
MTIKIEYAKQGWTRIARGFFKDLRVRVVNQIVRSRGKNFCASN